MTEMGMGRPKDALDSKCKAYKECQRCVRKNHGDECIGEFVEYTWKWANKKVTRIQDPFFFNLSGYFCRNGCGRFLPKRADGVR